MYKTVGTWWNDKNVELVELNGRVFALNGWNGEEFTECWECFGEHHMDSGAEHYTLRPVLRGIGEPDEDGSCDQYETIDYELLAH